MDACLCAQNIVFYKNLTLICFFDIRKALSGGCMSDSKTGSKIVVPPGAGLIMPYLVVDDVARAIAFYAHAFGCVPGVMRLDKEGHVTHGEFSYQGQMLMCGQQNSVWATAKTPRTSKVESPLSLYLYCADVDAFFDHATRAGAQSKGPPEDMFWGDRMCRLEDTDGYIWAFATHTGRTPS